VNGDSKLSAVLRVKKTAKSSIFALLKNVMINTANWAIFAHKDLDAGKNLISAFSSIFAVINTNALLCFPNVIRSILY